MAEIAIAIGILFVLGFFLPFIFKAVLALNDSRLIGEAPDHEEAPNDYDWHEHWEKSRRYRAIHGHGYGR